MAVQVGLHASSRDCKIKALLKPELHMYDPHYCLGCGLPFEPAEWVADGSGIGDDEPNWVTFIEDDVCTCAAEDDDD
jgi:hypothetical protein